jgi:magnesium transporter
MNEQMDETPTDASEDRRDAYALDDSLRGALRQAVEMGEVAVIDALMEPLHPADIADLLEQVSAGERAALLARLWSRDRRRGPVGTRLGPARGGHRPFARRGGGRGGARTRQRRCRRLLEDLDDDQAAAILDALDDRDRTAVQQALAYPEDTPPAA